MFERTWICEPNDSVSDQGFGEKDMHEWCLSWCQGCKKVAWGSMFYIENVLRERWESVLRAMSNSHHKFLFERVATLQNKNWKIKIQVLKEKQKGTSHFK